MKRIYIAFIQESWKENNKEFFKSDHKVLFDKSEILKYCTDLCRIYKDKYSYRSEYDIWFDILEFSSIRYIFKHPRGFIEYFDHITKNIKENLYDEILKCITCNVFKYDSNINLLETFALGQDTINSHLDYCLDAPLLEEQCIDGYHSNFRYLYYEDINKEENIDKTICNYLHLCKIYHEHEPYDNTDSGFDYSYFYYTNPEMKKSLNGIFNELLSFACNYTNNDNLSDEELIKIIKSKIKNLEVEIIEISFNDNNIIYHTNNIEKIMEDL